MNVNAALTILVVQANSYYSSKVGLHKLLNNGMSM